jgi:hypothetical protein
MQGAQNPFPKRNVQPPATLGNHWPHTRSWSRGKRFESARRLSFFIEVCWGTSVNGNDPSKIPAAGLCGWGGGDRVPPATRRPPRGGLWRNAEVAARVGLC